VPGFIKRIASGNLRGSALRILDANILGASCARVCPVDVLCEGACVMHRQNRKPIQIALLQRHAMDAFWASGETAAGESAPGTTSCAWPASAAGRHRWRVRRSCAAQGARATVIERRELPGGLNTYGVAEYKLRAADSVREVEMIRRWAWSSAAAWKWIRPRRWSAGSGVRFVFLGLGLGAMQRLKFPAKSARA
jgi:dihydropyrimidine dehydrogenase (NAD+) subunit PreT